MAEQQTKLPIYGLLTYKLIIVDKQNKRVHSLLDGSLSPCFKYYTAAMNYIKKHCRNSDSVYIRRLK